jgi:pilus assembly protein CpaF
VSFSLILPFLRPIEKFILDEEISEVMVNPDGRVFVERLGNLSEVAGVLLERKHVEVAVKNIARLLGGDISEERPILDSRLPDGSRVAAVFSPCSVGGTTLTIRKFHNRWFSIQELVASGCLPEEYAAVLIRAVSERKNILISGGTGTGKTTLLNALANLIPDSQRVVLIEDTTELQLVKPNLVRWEARAPRPDLEGVTIRQLVRASLRHRPDRLIVGEVRGAEAFDLLQALNTGHSGSLSTIHANSTAHAFARLTNCILESKIELPYGAICANIAASLDFVVQIQREEGQRVVTELVEVLGYDHDSDKFKTMPTRRGVERELRTPEAKPERVRRAHIGG